MNFLEGLDREWIMNHYPMIILSGLVFIQWIALQALVIHYHLFRQSLKKPTPDGIRFNTIEKVLSFQASQIDRVYGKLSELNKEISSVADRKPAERPAAQYIPPVDVSFVSLGEMNLKKRLNELRAVTAEPAAAKTSKLN